MFGKLLAELLEEETCKVCPLIMVIYNFKHWKHSGKVEKRNIKLTCLFMDYDEKLRKRSLIGRIAEGFKNDFGFDFFQSCKYF